MSVDVNDLFVQVLLPVIATILCGIASAVLTFGYQKLSAKWGVDIEAHHREALHSAIVTGINLGVQRTAAAVGPIPQIKVGNPLVKIAVEYAKRSVPDAIRRFDITEDRIEQMVLAKLPQVLGQTAASVSPPVST